MIRVYRLEQKRHSFQKAAVALVVSWYKSIKQKRTDRLGDHIYKWKKFRMMHASSTVQHSAVHNEIDKNLAAIAGTLTTSVTDLSNSVLKQANESQDLTRRCNENLQMMRSIADRLQTLLNDNDAIEKIKANVTRPQQMLYLSQNVSHESDEQPMQSISTGPKETRQQRFAKSDRQADHDIAGSANPGHNFNSSNDALLRHPAAIASENAAEQFQSNEECITNLANSVGSQNFSAGNHGSHPNELNVLSAPHRPLSSIATPLSPQISSSSHIQTRSANELMSSQSENFINQHAEMSTGRMKYQHSSTDTNVVLPNAGDSVYSSNHAISQMPAEANDYGQVRYQQNAPVHHEAHQISKQSTYHNQFADAAYSRSALAPGIAEGQVPIEGFYPPPHNYSPEAIQFHRDRIYEQARPSLNSILRSSPGLIPNSDTARIRPATYYSSKSPPVPLLTRPNSPGPKGFTPVRVKPFNPQGVISPVQGSAPAGSSSAYAKFLLARSEYKPESIHHSP